MRYLMSNNADIFVNFGDGALNVKCVITFEKFITNFHFSLSTLLTIDSITGDSNLEWKIINEWQPQWQHKSNKIEISSKTPIKEITIAYHGCILGWCNIIEENRIALSAYSAWTISETSMPIIFSFKLRNMEDYFVINGQYDSSEKLWIYGDEIHDEGNIIALKKGYYHVAKIDELSFYYLNEPEKIYADCYTYYYEDIIKYYKSVFPKKDINKIDIVCLGIEDGGGAYFRKELIVIDKLSIADNKDSIRKNTISLLAHELGHNWFTGASTSTWEDWLNETGAEWAALLYILSKNDKEFFEHQLEWVKKKYKETPPIKTPDANRPDGVHWRGTMMFYEIYKIYGFDMILSILQTLALLDEMTTSNFLSKLRIKLGCQIPDLVEKGLSLVDYSELF